MSTTILTDEQRILIEGECHARYAQGEKGLVRNAINLTEQAVLQSPEIQALRKDAERLDWIEANHGCNITEFVGGIWEVDVPDGPFGVRNSMREAIDHARRIEGDGE